MSRIEKIEGIIKFYKYIIYENINLCCLRRVRVYSYRYKYFRKSNSNVQKGTNIVDSLTENVPIGTNVLENLIQNVQKGINVLTLFKIGWK
jgi:hypothetical protein